MPSISWTLRSAFIEREICFEAGVGLYTRRWLHRLTQTDFLADAPSPAAEFAFAVDGQPPLTSLSGDWRLLRAEVGHQTLDVTLETAALRVVVSYRLHEHVLRKGLAITNSGAAPITLSHLTIETAALNAGRADEQRLFAFYGVLPRELFFTGRAEDPAVIQQNVRSGEGWIALNEAPGILKRIDTAWTWRGGVSVLYDTDIFPFERTLDPGESFSSARSGIAFFQQDSAADPRWVMPTYGAEVLLKKGAAYVPPWIYNTWETFFRDIHDTLIHTLIPIAQRMGFDIFTLDDGWQAELGETAVDLAHFPQGLDAIREAVEAQGMRLGLWWSLAPVGPQTAVCRQHPEWLCRDRRDNVRTTFTMSGVKPVMCLATPYRDHALQQITALVERYRLAYLKLDLTTVFNTYGEGPGCFAPGHAHRGWAESLTRTYEGIRYVTDGLYARFPDLLIDLTFELWGQKHIIDYGLLAAGDLDWLSNVHDLDAGGPRQARTLLYHRALAIPTEAMLIGNLQAPIEPIAERFATALGSTPVLLGDLRLLSAEQIAWYRQHIEWYKKLRREIPLYQGFFPLGNWHQPDALHWDGFARLSRRGEGLIALFKNTCVEESAEVQIPLFGAQQYQLRSVLPAAPPVAVSAEALREGISLPLRAPVHIWEIRVAE
ncbi:MAG: alpha-galactosidase [Chloroflexi bacterium]|nr:alpha-galactosidase [Chloroflexota bacterium]